MLLFYSLAIWYACKQPCEKLWPKSASHPFTIKSDSIKRFFTTFEREKNFLTGCLRNSINYLDLVKIFTKTCIHVGEYSHNTVATDYADVQILNFATVYLPKYL